MSPYIHAISSVKKWGGVVDDYIEIHRFLDSTKLHMTGWQHRAVLHSTFGIGICERIFGDVIRNSDNKLVEVRYIAMRHITEDCGMVPTVKDWLSDLPPKKFAVNLNKNKFEIKDTVSSETESKHEKDDNKRKTVRVKGEISKHQ